VLAISEPLCRTGMRDAKWRFSLRVKINFVNLGGYVVVPIGFGKGKLEV